MRRRVVKVGNIMITKDKRKDKEEVNAIEVDREGREDKGRGGREELW